MAISVKVPKKLSKIKTKFMFNLTKRQIFCFGLAALVGFPAYFLLRETVGTDLSALLMVILMLPFFFFAIYEKNGFPAEKVIWMICQQKWGRTRKRAYRSENLYQRLEQDEIRKMAQAEKTAKQEKLLRLPAAAAKNR